MKEGKRTVTEHLESLPINKDSFNHIGCKFNGKLVKLEIFADVDSVIREGKGRYHYLYWKCICAECGTEVLVLEGKLKFHESGQKGRLHNNA